MIIGATRLPFERGPLTIREDGVWTLGTGRNLTHFAYPFDSVEKFYQRDDPNLGLVTLRTDGARMLATLAGGVERPMLVKAGYDMFCALVISPEGVILDDVLDMNIGVDRRLVMGIKKPRFGLAGGSYISFHSSYGVDFLEPEGVEYELRQY